jgi:protein-S-isoprenylcysteine O-methyltransferase Ste14
MNKPKILPPVFLFITLAIMVILHWLLPLRTIIHDPYSRFGIAFMAIGFTITFASAGLFKTRGTPVKPFEQSTVLVTDGFYKLSRNPMYLGMAIALTGAAVRLGSLGAFLPIPMFIMWIRHQYIEREEVFLEEIFGQKYRDYKARVRRWI